MAIFVFLTADKSIIFKYETQNIESGVHDSSLKTKKLAAILLIISLALAIAAVIVYFQTPPLNRILKVVSGSMCVTYDGMCPGRQSPSEPTLHVGDYVVFEEVNPRDLNTDYPESDIIVFYKSTQTEEVIMHRIVATEERDGILYFYTKGDGNGFNKWPTIPERTEYDPWRVPEDLVVGKVTNYNLPFPLLFTSYWALVAVSVATAIAASVLLFSSRVKRKRNQRIEESEDRIRRLEEKEKKK